MTDPKLSAADRAALEDAKVRLGLDVEPAQLARLALRGEMRLGNVLGAIEEARFGEIGIALREALDGDLYPRAMFCLAVRRGEEVVVEVGHASEREASPSQVWPELRPWFKQLAKNLPRAIAWADQPGRIRLTLSGSGAPQTTTAIESALLREIVAAPADPAPRMVLADALLERDDVRGELIQLAEQITAATDHDLLDRLIDRRDALLARHGPRLAGDVAEHADAYEFEGGFVDAVTMTAGAFKKHGEKLFSTHPIRKLTLKPFNDASMAALAKVPHLRLVRVLELACADPRPVALAPLLGANLEQLTTLELRGCAIDGDDAARVFAGLAPPRLARLEIKLGWFGPVALRGLAENTAIGKTLEELELIESQPWRARASLDEAGQAVASAALAGLVLPRLRRLRIHRSWLTSDPGIAAVVRAAPALEHLECQDGGIETMRAAAGCRALRFLLACDCSPGAVAGVLALPDLEAIRFENQSMAPAAASELVETLLALPATHPLRRVHIFAGDRAKLHARFAQLGIN